MHKTLRRLRLASVAAAIQLALAGCGPSSPEEFVAKAQAEFDKGNLQAASVEVTNALSSKPNMVEARWLMAQIALKSGDAARAEKDIRVAIQYGLPRATAQLSLVRAILLQGAMDRALAETSIPPNDIAPKDRALLLGLRGQALILNGNPEPAQPVLARALEIDPKATTALVGMAILHLGKRDYDQVRPWIDRALAVDPASAEAWGALGELELATGKPEQAEIAYTNALKYRSHPSLDRARRALARVELKKFAEAQADIDALRQSGFKASPYVSYVQGLILFHQARYAEAANAFEACYAADPAFLANRMYLATTRFQLGQTEQALEHAKSLHARLPRSSGVRELLGSIQIGRSEYASARRMLESALHNAPSDPTTLRMLATLSMLEGDKDKGVEYARKIAALTPDSPDAQQMLMVAKLVAGQDFDVIKTTRPDAATDDYSRALLAALNDFRKGRIRAALEQANRIHEQHPDKVDPLNLVAACHLSGGEWDLARAALVKTLALQPNEPSAARNLAQLELNEGKTARAKELLEGLLKARPEQEEAALMLATIVGQGGDAKKALDVLEGVVKSNPDALVAAERLAAAHLNAGNLARVIEITGNRPEAQLHSRPGLLESRGKAQMLTGNVAAARASFEQWVRVEPDSATARFLLGDTLARSGETAQARQELQRAVQLDRLYLPARVGEIKMLVRAGDLDKARQKLDKLRPEFGEQIEVLGIEGWFALGTGNPAKAEESFAAALRKRPDAEMTILLARSLLLQTKTEAGLAVLEGWLKEHPQDLGVLMELAGSHLALSRDADAIAVYARILETYPSYVPALNNIAWLHRDKDRAKAMEYAQRAQNLAPTDPDVLDTLAMLTLKGGDRLRAYNLIREASQRAPERPEIQMHLATVLLEREQRAEAHQVLRTVMEKFPKSAEARQARELLEQSGARTSK